MAPFESLRNESLTSKEEAAFTELADTLIFGSPQHFKLSRKNVPELSQRVQDSFRLQDILHEQAWADYLVETTATKISDSAPGVDSAQISNEKRIEEHPDERSKAEKVLSAARLYIEEHTGAWGIRRYGAWGFTPKLAGTRSEEYERPYQKDGKNCFGVVQGLGALFSDMGISCEMAITAEHPFAIVTLEGRTYLASSYGMDEVRGWFEPHDGYKLYIPSTEDKIFYKLVAVWNFDEALVYELLENFEVLRRMSLGEKVTNLPGTEKQGKEIAEQNRGTLQGASWRNIQEKVTPQLARYFHDHRTEWALELERVGISRQAQYFFDKAMEAGQSATSMKDLSYGDFSKIFLPIAKEHRIAIINGIVSGIEPGPETPAEVVLFTQKVREVLDTISAPEIRTRVTEAILRPYVELDEPLTEK